MTKKMFDAHRATTHELFTKDPAAFVIPPHQREYAWTAVEVDTLINDLFEEDHERWDRPYFLGALLFSTDEESNNYAVLDGQQRLVTLSLLISAIRQRLKELGDSVVAAKLDALIQAGKITEEPIPKMVLQPPDHPVYEELLADGNQAACLQKPKLKKHALIRAWKQISEYMARITSLEHLRKMVNRLLYQVTFVQIEATSNAEAFTLFETLNDRGLALNAADLIKNRLLAMVSPARINKTRDEWESALRMVKKENVLHFLRHYYIGHYGYVRKEDLYSEIKKTLPNREQGAINFIEHLQSQALLYKHIVEPNDSDAPWSPRARRILGRLRLVNVSTFRPLVLLVQESFPDQLEGLLVLLESLTIRFSIFGAKNPNRLEKAYSELAERIRTARGGGQPVDVRGIATDVLRPIQLSDDEFSATFVAYAPERVTPATRAVMAALHEFATQGETTPAEPADLHVDHILPVSLPLSALHHGGLNETTAEQLVGTLGNLTFLRAKPNMAVGNRTFPEKKGEYAEAQGLPLTRELAAINVWNEAAIRSRTERLFGLAVRGWPCF